MSQESRVCSPSLAAHPGDPERHGFLCTRQQLSGEKQSTGAPDQPGTLNPLQANSHSLMYLFEVVVFVFFFRYIPKSGIAGSYGGSIFRFPSFFFFF